MPLVAHHSSVLPTIPWLPASDSHAALVIAINAASVGFAFSRCAPAAFRPGSAVGQSTL